MENIALFSSVPTPAEKDGRIRKRLHINALCRQNRLAETFCSADLP